MCVGSGGKAGQESDSERAEESEELTYGKSLCTSLMINQKRRELCMNVEKERGRIQD